MEISIQEIKTNPKNPRTISPEKLEKLKQSIKDFPGMLALRPIIVDEDNMSLGGNMRLKALMELGYKTIPQEWVKKVSELTEEQKREFIIKDNLGFGEWDNEMLAAEWNMDQLEAWGLDTFNLKMGLPGIASEAEEAKRSLAERFIVPPFSILDSRQGYWQDRKRLWLSIGIESEVGREKNMTFAKSAQGSHIYELRNKMRAEMGVDPSWEQIEARAKDLGYFFNEGTSIFDPVLTEICYKWFCPDGGTIIDPFAGGSVRGIVAGFLGFNYHGVDLRAEQVEANREQAAKILQDKICPKWTTGDSVKINELVDERADLVFSCPPYFDLEVYSDDKSDLSNMTWAEFSKFYEQIIHQCIFKLKEDRFACFVIGEVRDQKTGFYRNLVPFTIECFERAGAKFYNEIVLANVAGSLAIRAGKQFSAGRKIGKMHQNVLVFYKGDPKKIKENFKEIEVAELENNIEDSLG